jgi:hypothetical protein
MKIFTQAFDDSTRTMASQVLKISRDISETADNLARLAFYSSAVQSDQYVPLCSYEHHACSPVPSSGCTELCIP